MDAVFEDNIRVFKAFCDERRLAILEMLREGEKCACVLLAKMNISQSTLSYHMKVLCDSGIVSSRQEGKWTHYRISDEGCTCAVEMLRALTATQTTDQNTKCCQ